MIVNNRLRRSHFVYNSYGLTPHSKRSPYWYLNTFLFETRTSPLQGGVLGGSECGNVIRSADFCIIVLHSNYGSILLCFRDITTGRTTDGRTDVSRHRIWPLRRASNNLTGYRHVKVTEMYLRLVFVYNAELHCVDANAWISPDNMIESLALMEALLKADVSSDGRLFETTTTTYLLSRDKMGINGHLTTFSLIFSLKYQTL